LVFLLARVLQKQISLPILVLAGTAEAISNHRDYSVRAPKLGEDELGRLTDAFNQMLEEIQAQEQALRKSEERFRALVESGEDGIVVSDSKGAALYVSPALLRMLGRAEEDFLGKSRPDLVHPDDLPYVMDKMAETLKNPGKAIQARYRLRHKDGSWRWIDMTATNLLDKPAVGGIIRNIRDVTEKLKLEEIARIGEAQAIASINDYAILMLDTEGKILTWNAGAERIKGYKASEIIGKPISVFYTPEDNARNHSKELLKAALKEGSVEDEGWRVRKDGSRFQADVIITALKNERGELRGFIKVTRDVTKIKKAQEKIRESEERFRSIIESAPSAIIVADGEGRIQTWNQQALHLFGYQEGEVLGHPLTILMPERYREAHSAGIKRVSETGRSKLIGRSVELAGLRKDGTEFPMQLSLSSWKTGEKLFYGGIIQDITDLKRQQELELYTRALEVSNKELQDFVFVASHDLQEPLRKVLSFGEFLQEEYGGKLEETGKDYLDRIRSAATRMQTLINDLLT
ncbi:MAG TPA: PAS domain S-box protein, partial [bacterium]|nr:PAS domain S-box protein [bacterium]